MAAEGRKLGSPPFGPPGSPCPAKKISPLSPSSPAKKTSPLSPSGHLDRPALPRSSSPAPTHHPSWNSLPIQEIPQISPPPLGILTCKSGHNLASQLLGPWPPPAPATEAEAAAAEVAGADGTGDGAADGTAPVADMTAPVADLTAPGAGDRAGRLPSSAAAAAAATTAAGGPTALVLGASSSQACVWRQLSASKPGVSSR